MTLHDVIVNHVMLHYSGTHQRIHGSEGCNWNEAVVKVKAFISANQQYYFPTELVIDGGLSATSPRKQGFGGWGDPRDHKLCLSFVH